MSERDPAIVQSAREWVQYADEDLRYAQHGLAIEEGCPFRLVAYHAQQCAEKYLKSYLVLSGMDFPYTHDIERLLSLCASAGGSIDQLAETAELTSYAIVARYPGTHDEVSLEDAQRAVQLAALVGQTVRQWLTDAGLQDLF